LTSSSPRHLLLADHATGSTVSCTVVWAVQSFRQSMHEQRLDLCFGAGASAETVLSNARDLATRR